MQTKLTDHKGTREAAINAFIPFDYRPSLMSRETKKDFQCDFRHVHWQKEA